MSKDTIVAAINGGNGKKVQGVAGAFSSPDGKNVFVEFTEPKSETPQEVHFSKIQWPHHKATSAAEKKKNAAISNYVKTLGANTAGESLISNEIAEFFPAD
jgi:hypothetical protein